MQKTVVLNVVGLSSRLIGYYTPFLKKYMEENSGVTVKPAFPAVTTTAQYTYLTGKTPDMHGIVGNGWYFRDECEVKFWRQSNKLVQAPQIWEHLKAIDPSFTCANLFWWYNMYSSADYSVTPRPMYPADGRKLPDVYSNPMSLRDRLQSLLGTFPLYDFWGPKTTIRSTKWIAEAAKLVDKWHNPTLNLVYLPHLDYCLQKHGFDLSKISKDLQEIDKVCKDLVRYFERSGANVIILSEYGIINVSKPIHINQVLRKYNFLKVKEELGLELLDAGASKAFAVADHQIAHVYCPNPKDRAVVKELLLQQDEIDDVLDFEGKKAMNINHSRAGDLVAIAKPDAWFTYYYWFENDKAPDFARTVDIHRKPGYDPMELFVDPAIKHPNAKIMWKVMLKKMGFRTLMNITPLDASLLKGSHGRIPESEQDYPVFISGNYMLDIKGQCKATDVYKMVMAHLVDKKKVAVSNGNGHVNS